MRDPSLFLCWRWNRVGVHSEQFDKGSDWAERKERKSRVCQIQLILLLIKRFLIYVTVQKLIDRLQTDAITGSYCIIRITVCHWVPLATRSLFLCLSLSLSLSLSLCSPSLPLLVPPFTKITYIFISFA